MGSERQDREQTARVAQRAAWGDLVAQLRAGQEPVSCVRPDELEHRLTDTRLKATDALPPGPWVCGICHPPPPALEEQSEPRFPDGPPELQPA